MPRSRADFAGTQAQGEALCLQGDCTRLDEAPEMKGWKPLPCRVVTEGKDATLGTQKTQKANEGRLRISEDLEIPLSQWLFKDQRVEGTVKSPGFR